MPNTPVPLEQVIEDKDLAAKVHKILVKEGGRSVYEMHGITIRPLFTKDKIRALVFWGDFPPDDDALAEQIRRVLNATGEKRYEVSQVGPPHQWGKFCTATLENPFGY